MKKSLLLAAAALVAASALQAKTAEELRIYLNPGHGSFTSNDRPMNTIAHPTTTSLKDTLGFYEGRGTLPRSLYIGHTLQEMGVKKENIVFSRTKNGPWPTNSESSTKYNRGLSEICEEVEAGNFDMFVASHSDGSNDKTANYSTYLYRGTDASDYASGSKAMAQANHPYHLATGIENYSRTASNIRGDISFYGSSSTATRSNGKSYTGYLGVLKHGTPGYLLEGFFHSYPPARHRALNFDYDRHEGLREARGIGAYFGLPTLKTGAILGTVKDAVEVMNHSLYTYRAGTDDQFVPLNGATVKLMKDGNEVATYTTDQEWNGVFSFFDVAPGTYQLVASHPGHATSSPVDITVKANETSYAKMHLDVTSLEEYTFTQDAGTTYAAIEGTVMQTLQQEDNTIVLSHSGKDAHLYVVDNKTKQATAISTEGIYKNETNPGFYNQIGSIALTQDGKLVSVSSVRNSSDDSQVDVADGYERGTLYSYIWDSLDATPRQFFTTQHSGNYYNADMGYAVAVNGSSTLCTVAITAVTSSSSRAIRFTNVTVANGTVTKTWHANTNAEFSGTTMGDVAAGARLALAVSPNNSKNYILGSSNGKVAEFEMPTVAAGVPTAYTYLPTTHGVNGAGLSFVNLSGFHVMVAPYGKTSGIKLLDVSDGLNNAKLVKTTNTDVPASSAVATASYNGAGAWVDGMVVNAYLTGDNSIVRFTTDTNIPDPDPDPEPEPSEVLKGIYAYNLNVTNSDEDDAYNFSFVANNNAREAFLTFYDAATGTEVGSKQLKGIVEGCNTVTVANEELPGNPGQELTWAITLKGFPITEFKRLNSDTNWSYTNASVAVDNLPESPHFGNIYVDEWTTQRLSDKNGLYIYNPDWTRVNSTAINKRSDGYEFNKNLRITVGGNGKVYVPDFGDAQSGVFMLDPANYSAGFQTFFRNADGPLTRTSTGLLTNAAGAGVAGSSPSVWVQGTGANTRMYVYNEDLSPKNNVHRYDIGEAQYWNQAPSFTYNISSYEANGNGNVVADDEGNIWVSQNRSSGQNTSNAASLLYVDKNGTVQYKSFNDASIIPGSPGGGFAISKDKSKLVLHTGAGNLRLFNVIWNGNTPTLAKSVDYTCNVQDGGGNVYQMAFDYGGNLIVAGKNVGIYAMPSDVNESTTPAKKSLTVVKRGRAGEPGDVNLDGDVDITDINIIVKILLGKDNASNYGGRADVNSDNSVDVIDINAIMQILLSD